MRMQLWNIPEQRESFNSRSAELIKKDKINEINTKIKSKDIVTQKLAIEELNSSIRLLC